MLGNSHERLIVSPARAARSALGRDLDVAVLLRCAADEVGKHRVLEAFPPGHLGLVCGGRRRREPVRHIERGLQHGCGTPRQRERERRGEYTQMAEWDAGGGWVRHGSKRKGTVAASRQRSVDVLSGFCRKRATGLYRPARIDLSSARQASPNAFNGSAPAERASWRISSHGQVAREVLLGDACSTGVRPRREPAARR